MIFLYSAPGRFYGRAGALGHAQTLNGHGFFDLARGDYLDLGYIFGNQVGFFQRLEIDDPSFDFFQFIQADLVYAASDPGSESDLRQAPLQGHLTTLKTDLMVTAGTGFLALMPAARRLAQTRAHAPAHAFTRRFRSRCGFNGIQAHFRPPSRPVSKKLC